MLGPFGAKHITICHNKCQNDGAHTQHGASRKVNTSMSPSWTTLWWCSLKIRHLADWSRLSRAGKSSTRLGISQGRSSKGWFSQRFSVAMFDDTRGHVILELFVDCDSHKSGVPRQLEPTFRWSKIWPRTVPWDPTKMTFAGQWTIGLTFTSFVQFRHPLSSWWFLHVWCWWLMVRTQLLIFTVCYGWELEHLTTFVKSWILSHVLVTISTITLVSVFLR